MTNIKNNYRTYCDSNTCIALIQPHLLLNTFLWFDYNKIYIYTRFAKVQQSLCHSILPNNGQ